MKKNSTKNNFGQRSHTRLPTQGIQEVKTYLLNLQEYAKQQLSAVEKSQDILVDSWHKPPNSTLNGNGVSMIVEEGDVIEKGGINFSHVRGDSLPESASAMRQNTTGKSFQALGVSMVLHPKNPWVPTAHANVRLFVLQDATTSTPHSWWFGGGFDLTPYYPIQQDVVYWHQQAKNICQPYGEEIYPLFKKQCDEYFYLKHRDEMRGVGGIFFDNLNTDTGWSFKNAFSFVQAVGNTFVESYMTILKHHYDKKYTHQQRQFQLYRRGRYVEFNLLYDRGTIFGLQSGGRTESILMSLPNQVRWCYDWQAEPDSLESKLHQYLKPRDWV